VARHPGGVVVIQILKALRTEGAKCIEIPREPYRTADPHFDVGLREKPEGAHEGSPSLHERARTRPVLELEGNAALPLWLAASSPAAQQEERQHANPY
jgi:hypothetical protein